MTDTKPVAWMYRAMTTAEADRVEFTRAPWSSLLPRWTETPLYASPQPCTDCDKLREEKDRLGNLLLETADRHARAIVALELEVERLREALELIATDGLHTPSRNVSLARAALNGGKDD